MKKLLSILCAAAVSVSAFTLPAYAVSEQMQAILDNQEQIGDFIYTKDTHKIVGYTGDPDNCVIPDNSVVSSFGASTRSITKITVGSGTDYIGALNTPNLKELVFAEGITEVPDNAFKNCTSLEKVTFPSTMKVIGEYAFFRCTSLKSIDFSHTALEEIKAFAFYEVGLNGDLIFPDTLKILKDNSFAVSGKLKKVHIPDTIKEYSGISAADIEEINIPDSYLDNPPVTSATEIIFNSDMTIPIYEAVYESSWCTDKYLKGKTDKTIEFVNDMAILDNTVLKYLGTDKNPVVPDGVKSIGKLAFLRCNIETVSLPDSLEEIGFLSFSGSALKSVKIPKNVKLIKEAAFHDCPRISELIFEGAPKFEQNTFDATPSLNGGKIVFMDESIVLPEDFYHFREYTYIEEATPWEWDGNPTSSPSAAHSPFPSVLPSPSVSPDTTAKPTSVPSAAPTAKPVFEDIPTDNEALITSVEFLYEKKIIDGYNDGSFAPDKKITRAEIAKILDAASGSADETTAEYSDVSDSHWAYDFISRSKFFNGYEDGTFKPDSNITNAELITVAVRFAGFEEEAETDIEPYPINYIKTAEKHQLTKGLNLNANNIASRGDTAVLIYNAMNS